MCLVRPAQTVCLGFISYYWSMYHRENDKYEGKWNSSRNCIFYSAAGLCLSTLLNVLLSHPYFMETYRMGMQIRIACCHLIYRKALKLSQASLLFTIFNWQQQLFGVTQSTCVSFRWSIQFNWFFSIEWDQFLCI